MITPVTETQVFGALADPIRRQLVVDLAAGSSRTATQLAPAYAITRQGLLKHLNVLQNAGLVTTSRHGRESRYSLAPDSLDDAARWIRDVTATWDDRLQRLKAFVEDVAAEP